MDLLEYRYHPTGRADPMSNVEPHLRVSGTYAARRSATRPGEAQGSLWLSSCVARSMTNYSSLSSC